MEDYIDFEELNSEFEEWFKDDFKFSNEYYELEKLNNGEFSYKLKDILKEIFTNVYETAYNRGIDEGYGKGKEDAEFDNDNFQ